MSGGKSSRPCILAAIAYIIMVIVNVLANALPINGVKTGEAAARYPSLFTPAPGTFGIWGLIYVLLLTYTLYQLGVFRWERGSTPCATALTQQIAPWYGISSLANALWIIAFHYDLMLVSMGLMVLLLYCLGRIMQLICTQPQLCMKEKLFVRIPFSVYFAWIIVATIANASSLLVSLGWDGFGLAPEVWTVIALILGAGLGITAMILCKNTVFGLTFIWAYAGILVRHASSEGWDGAYPAVITTSIICLIAFFAALGYLLFQKTRQ